MGHAYFESLARDEGCDYCAGRRQVATLAPDLNAIYCISLQEQPHRTAKAAAHPNPLRRGKSRPPVSSPSGRSAAPIPRGWADNKKPRLGWGLRAAAPLTALCARKDPRTIRLPPPANDHVNVRFHSRSCLICFGSACSFMPRSDVGRGLCRSCKIPNELEAS
jgi:hypothetical protein